MTLLFNDRGLVFSFYYTFTPPRVVRLLSCSFGELLEVVLGSCTSGIMVWCIFQMDPGFLLFPGQVT